MLNKPLSILLIISLVIALVVAWKYKTNDNLMRNNKLPLLVELHHSVQANTFTTEKAPYSPRKVVTNKPDTESIELLTCDDGLHHAQEFIDLSAKDQTLQQSLLNSNEIEHQFLANMLNRDTTLQAKIDSLSNLLKDSPNNEIISYNLLALCAEGQQLCTQELLDRIMSVQKDNGAAWALISSISAQKDHEQQAIQALISASKAPFFDNYLELNTKFIDNAYRDMGADDDLLLYVALMTHGISSSPPVIPIINLCQPPLLSDSKVLDACFHAGNIFRQGTPMTKIGGAAIQMYVYIELGDDSALQEVKKELKELEKHAIRHSKAMDILARHKNSVADWLEFRLAGDDSGSEIYAITKSKKIEREFNSNACNFNW
ncbi:MAG: hypothetical protein ACPGSN_07005 [Psychrobium sp.]